MLKYALEKIQINIARLEQRRARKVLMSCLQRWEFEDDRTKYFYNIFDNWIAQIPKNAYDMVLQLLTQFCYYPHQVVNKLLVNLHVKLSLENTINQNNTIYIPIKSADGHSNSSNEYWSEYKLQNNLSKFIVIDDIGELTIDQWPHITNIVLIDDCGGSGRTVTKYIERHKDLFKDKNIYFIAIHLMKNAQERILNFGKENDINLFIVCSFIQEKAFNHSYYKNNKLKDSFIVASEDLCIPKDDILGYKKSEGLFAFYNNTPNNTLGLFRYDTETYKSPFPRKQDEKPDWWNLKAGKKLREIQNYRSVVERSG